MTRTMRRMLVGLVVTVSLLVGGVVFAQNKPKTTPAPGTGQAATTTGMEMSKTTTVDLNTADEAALKSLTGIGPAKAKAILKYRQEHGGFKSVDELKKVPGIGDKTLAALRPMLTVSTMN